MLFDAIHTKAGGLTGKGAPLAYIGVGETRDAGGGGVTSALSGV